jgi:Tol biopolymer transport system component
MTRGDGADTEAAWSPDGREIAFQRERDGRADLLVLEAATGKTRVLVAGPGDARYPCWSPDGRAIVYSYGHITTTAQQGIPDGYNLFSVSAAGGEPRRLTSGQARDYTPAFTPDGKELYFATTRGLVQNDAALEAMRLDTGAMRSVVRFGATNMGAVSPSISPDGKLLAFAAQQGLRANWAIMLARTSDLGMRAVLTEQEWVMYAPRWSPDGKFLACTGYRVGDPGWGIYLIRIPDGAMARLATGEGNSRSPAWSPDGTSLVFENNRTGDYKLYRMAVGNPTFEPPPRRLTPQPARALLKLDLSQIADGKLPDRSGRGHDAAVTGSFPKTADGSVQCGKGFARVEGDKDFAFGRNAFYVTVDVFIESNPKKLQMIAMGDYPEHRLGWQIYVDPKGQGVFNARDPAGIYVGARTPTPLPVGKRVTLTGVRDARGDVSLIVRGGVVCDSAATGATMSYGPPNQLRIGSQFNGGDRFQGRLYSVEVGIGVPPEKRKTMLDIREVLGE